MKALKVFEHISSDNFHVPFANHAGTNAILMGFMVLIQVQVAKTLIFTLIHLVLVCGVTNEMDGHVCTGQTHTHQVKYKA